MFVVLPDITEPTRRTGPDRSVARKYEYVGLVHGAAWSWCSRRRPAQDCHGGPCHGMRSAVDDFQHERFAFDYWGKHERRVSIGCDLPISTEVQRNYDCRPWIGDKNRFRIVPHQRVNEESVVECPRHLSTSPQTRCIEGLWYWLS